MREILSSIEGEWRRYKVLAERALEQTRDEELTMITSVGSNSIAVIVTHIGGNLKSRFADFLTADGEKPWRDRDAEFEPRTDVTRQELLERWADGWRTLFTELEPLTDLDLKRTVTIRGEKFLVHETLLRLLAHTSYHVGQIVQLAKAFRGNDWNSLSIPRGKSQEYNRNPKGQRPPAK
jgi:Protein of unknown function (DUF1572)